MAPFYGWDSSPLSSQESRVPGSHLIDIGRMKGRVDHGATQWF